jgi:antitoxin component of MazEF toxin-antitoxin module
MKQKKDAMNTKGYLYSERVVKWGNSNYVLVPADIMKKLSLKPKDRVYVDIQKQAL